MRHDQDREENTKIAAEAAKKSKILLCYPCRPADTRDRNQQRWRAWSLIRGKLGINCCTHRHVVDALVTHKWRTWDIHFVMSWTPCRTKPITYEPHRSSVIVMTSVTGGERNTRTYMGHLVSPHATYTQGPSRIQQLTMRARRKTAKHC